MRFSVVYQPTSLFSLKESNATNSGSKSLLLPSPYAIKMALINQAITELGTEPFKAKKSTELAYIRDAKVFFKVSGSFCINNCFVTIQSQRDGAFRGKPSFLEYIYFSDNIEIIFEVDSEEAKYFLKQYLHRINYFGKRGCFFQFREYLDSPSDPNVKEFDAGNMLFGVLQEFDDMSDKAEFKNVNNYDSASAKRDKKILVVPVENVNSSKSYTHYR